MTDDARTSLEFSPEEQAADFKEVGEHINAPMLPQHGVAALAMNMSLKYWDINTITDGALYQQLKLEGRNIGFGVHLDSVIDVAKRIELHILNAPNRLSQEVYAQLTAEFFEDVESALSGEEEPDIPSEASAGKLDGEGARDEP